MTAKMIHEYTMAGIHAMIDNIAIELDAHPGDVDEWHRKISDPLFTWCDFHSNFIRDNLLYKRWYRIWIASREGDMTSWAGIRVNRFNMHNIPPMIRDRLEKEYGIHPSLVD